MHTLALSRIKNVPPRGLGEKSWNNLTQQVEGSSRGISLNRFLFEDICDAWASEDAVQQACLCTLSLILSSMNEYHEGLSFVLIASRQHTAYAVVKYCAAGSCYMKVCILERYSVLATVCSDIGSHASVR